MEHESSLTRPVPPASFGESVDDHRAEQYLQVRRNCPTPGVVVYTATGEVDQNTAALFEDAVRDPGQDGVAALVVDLSQVRFLGVAGLRALHGAATLAAARGQWFAVVANTRPVCRVLELCRVLERGGTGQRTRRYRQLADALLAAPGS